jgi:site-specific DNA recombinase
MLKRTITPDSQLPPAFGPDGSHAIAVVTLRISPRPQPGEISLEKQEAETLAWCASRGLTVAAVYVDNKISGRSRKKRLGFNAAMEEAKRLRAVLVGHNLSRLARSTKDMLAINDELNDAGCSMATATGLIVDTTKPDGRLVLTMLAAMHQYFAEVHAALTSEALQWRKAQGRVYNRRTPFGWGKCNKRLVRNENEQRVIRWTVWRHQLGFGTMRLVQELQARGYHGYDDRPITRQMLRQVIERHGEKEVDWTREDRLPVIDASDWHIRRLELEAATDSGVAEFLNRYAGKYWGQHPGREGEWPHRWSWTDVADGPVMDNEGYLTVRLDELREIQQRARRRLHKVWPLLPKRDELVAPLGVVRAAVAAMG